ncbi:hypothetical protein FOZ62_003932, partial [Perkinsus olseni]
MPSTAGSLPSTIFDIDVSASRADLHSDQIYTRPMDRIDEVDVSREEDGTEDALVREGLQIRPLGDAYYCPACLESLPSLWAARQHVQTRDHREAMVAVDDSDGFDSSSDDDDDP